MKYSRASTARSLLLSASKQRHFRRIAQPRVEPPGELLVLRAVADEAGMVLERLDGSIERGNEGDGLFRHAAAEKKTFRNHPT